jgi:hypothetical protein
MDLLWGLVVVLVLMWMLGFSLHIGAGLVHILLVVALVVVLFRVVAGRRAF